ncbi:MAG: hypothetical protein FWG64_04275 [Firmicutes bacterium]|nr:hypothetical protein [Bacillota bacterium]
MNIRIASIFTKIKQKSNFKYDDIINLLHNNPSNIVEVSGVSISVADLAYNYEGVTKNKNTIEQIVNAHNEVLTHGLTKGAEMLMAIDLNTGEIVAKNYGTENSVDWQLASDYKGKVITIHNHSSNTTFSPADLFTFSKEKRIAMSVIQAHNGKIFSLRKTTDLHEILDIEKMTEQFLSDIKNSGVDWKSDKTSLNHILELYVKKSKEKYNWIYKGGDSYRNSK